MRCDHALEAISAAADGEVTDDDVFGRLEEHLADCSECRAFERTVVGIRSALRFEPVDGVPDVAPAVGSALSGQPPKQRARAGTGAVAGIRSRLRGQLRVAAVAAAIGMIVGATFVGLGRDPQPPAAADLAERVMTAQRDITTLDIRFQLTEPGRRSFDGTLTYAAPESLALTLTGRRPAADTRPSGADGGTEGDVRLVVDEDRWSLDTLRACTTCPGGVSRWHQTVAGREPFSDAVPIPLELVTAVDSFALSGPLPQLGTRTIAGRPAIGVQVPAAQVARFLAALSPAGDLRPVHPRDPVEVWLERDHLVPLEVEVRAGDSAERARWAAGQGLADEPGAEVLAYVVHTIDIDGDVDLPAPSVDGTTARPATEQFRDDGFRSGDAPAVPTPTTLPSGLRPYAAGVIRAPGGPEVELRSWTDGRAWLKIRATTDWDQPRLFGGLGSAVRIVDLGAAGRAYVSADGRAVALHTEGLDLVVTGSLPADELRTVAAGLGVVGEAVPAGWPEHDTTTIDDARAAQPGLLVPAGLEGFAPPAVLLDRGVVVQVYAGPGDRSFVLTRSPSPDLAPPSNGDSQAVEVRGVPGRYSVERGELEWADGGASYSLSSPSLSLAELVAIADALTDR